MKNRVIIIRRHPIVFIRNIFIAQLGAFVIYSIVASFADYGPIYDNLIFSKIISYETARFLFLTLIEAFLTIYVFTRWFLEKYNFSRDAIIHDSGIILKKKMFFSLASPLSASYSINPLGKFLKYGNIIIKSTHEIITIRNITNPQQYIHAILQKQNQVSKNRSEEKPSVTYLLSLEEHEQLEFKSTLRWDMRLNQSSKDVEKASMKTIAAFLNSAGGHLVIGIDDKKNPLGIHYDYNSLPKKDVDGFENHFTQICNTMIGPEFRRHIQLTFDNVNNKEICIVNVVSSPKPVYLRTSNEESFFIRTGNTTTSLKPSETESYIKNRWS